MRRGGPQTGVQGGHYLLGPLHTKTSLGQGLGGGRTQQQGWTTPQNQFGRGVGGGRLKQLLVQKSSTRWSSIYYLLYLICYLLFVISYLISLISYLLSFISYLIYLKDNFYIPKITIEGTVFTNIFSRYLPHSYFNNYLPLFCINGCLEWVTQSPPVDVYKYARIYACCLYVTLTECRLFSSFYWFFAMV